MKLSELPNIISNWSYEYLVGVTLEDEVLSKNIIFGALHRSMRKHYVLSDLNYYDYNESFVLLIYEVKNNQIIPNPISIEITDINRIEHTSDSISLYRKDKTGVKIYKFKKKNN